MYASLILTDPRTDHQPIREAALGNIPTSAFCDTDSPMKHVDIGILANNKGKHSIGCLFWMLSRMVLQMRGTILPGHKGNVKNGEQWGTEVVDVQWGAPETGAIPGSIPTIAAADWTGAPGPLPAEGWDAAPAPLPTAAGWDAAAMPSIPGVPVPSWETGTQPNWTPEPQ